MYIATAFKELIFLMITHITSINLVNKMYKKGNIGQIYDLGISYLKQDIFFLDLCPRVGTFTSPVEIENYPHLDIIWV